MSNHEIVNYQLDKCENIIHEAIKTKFINWLSNYTGKGLKIIKKRSARNLLSFKLDFKDSDYMRYSGGATGVFLDNFLNHFFASLRTTSDNCSTPIFLIALTKIFLFLSSRYTFGVRLYRTIALYMERV